MLNDLRPLGLVGSRRGNHGGYLLTDAHVVWPYDAADRVRFPDGRVLRDVPVVALDLLADLALLRVGEVPGVQPLQFGDPTRVAVGSEVYLLGYPAERQPNPTPTFSRGLLSRVRIGGPLDLPFAQTDALSAPGGSGPTTSMPDTSISSLTCCTASSASPRAASSALRRAMWSTLCRRF